MKSKDSSGYDDDAFECSSSIATAAEEEYAQLVATSKSSISLQTISESASSYKEEEIDLDDI